MFITYKVPKIYECKYESNKQVIWSYEVILRHSLIISQNTNVFEQNSFTIQS